MLLPFDGLCSDAAKRSGHLPASVNESNLRRHAWYAVQMMIQKSPAICPRIHAQDAGQEKTSTTATSDFGVA
jgi:hypothetical protein